MPSTADRRTIINRIKTDAYPPLTMELSRFWARNRGLSEASALANLLKSLRKVAGHLGPNVGQVLFPGMSFADAAAIMIDPSPARNTTYPLDYHIIDVMAGQVVHEAYRRIEWSQQVWRLLEEYMAAMTGRQRVSFQKLIDMAETIYVDLAADHTTAGLYAHKARHQALHQFLPQQNRTDTLDFFLLVWLQSAWPAFNHQLPELDDAPAELLKSLRPMLQALKTISGSSARPIERCRQRADLYQQQWRVLCARIMTLPVKDKTLFYYPEYGVSTKLREASSGKELPPLPVSLIHEMELQLTAGAMDLTPIVHSVAGYDNPDVVRMSRWDYSQPCRPVIDRRMVSRLKSIFLNYGPYRRITSTGLASGKVDPRRLYRAPLTGKCFRQRYIVAEDRWQICLLIDASGSMRGNKMRIVENTMANLNKAICGGRNRLSVYAYFEVNNICMFSSLLSNNRLLTVPPAGKTASGQAIIAAAWLMERGHGRQRSLIVHITDGESNFGCDVRYGIEFCHREKISLVTLGCGCQDRTAMKKQYGHTIQFLKSYEQLPQAMERLFKRLFLHADPSAGPVNHVVK